MTDGQLTLSATRTDAQRLGNNVVAITRLLLHSLEGVQNLRRRLADNDPAPLLAANRLRMKEHCEALNAALLAAQGDGRQQQALLLQLDQARLEWEKHCEGAPLPPAHTAARLQGMRLMHAAGRQQAIEDAQDCLQALQSSCRLPTRLADGLVKPPNVLSPDAQQRLKSQAAVYSQAHSPAQRAAMAGEAATAAQRQRAGEASGFSVPSLRRQRAALRQSSPVDGSVAGPGAEDSSVRVGCPR